MNNYAVIENNLVVNNVVSEPEYAAEQGWILMPEAVGIGWSYANGNFVNENIPIIDEKVTEVQVQSALDVFAQEKGFDNINDAASYANSTNEVWAKEAIHAIAMRDTAWQAFYDNKPLPNMIWS